MSKAINELGVGLMKKLISYFTICICCLGLMCGCASYPDLSDEEMDLVAEYAAGLLLKYSSKADYRLMNVDEALLAWNNEVQKETQEDKEEKEEEQEEPEIPSEETPDKENEQGTSVTDNTQQETVSRPINEVLGLETLSIVSNGYEIEESYQDGSEAFVSLDATEGYKLVILKYTLVNNGTESVNVNMLENSSTFRVSLDGSGYKVVKPTMLLNDFASYKGTIAPGTSVELVLLSEWKEEEINNMSNLTLYVKNDDLSGKYSVE